MGPDDDNFRGIPFPFDLSLDTADPLTGGFVLYRSDLKTCAPQFSFNIVSSTQQVLILPDVSFTNRNGKGFNMFF